MKSLLMVVLLMIVPTSACPESVVVHPLEPKSPLHELLQMDQVFVGRVDSLRFVRPVKGTVEEAPFSEFHVRGDEVFNGGGIHPTESVRMLGRSNISVGDRVFVSGWRSSIDEWRIWASVRKVEENRILRRGSDGRGVEDLNEVREAARTLRRHLSMAPFEEFEALDLVVVRTATSTRQPSSQTFECEPMRRILGAGPHGSITLQFKRVNPEPGPPVGVGDSLLVPSRRGAERVRVFETTSNYFRVRNGWLPGFGVSLGKVKDAFVRKGELYSLKSLLGASP